MKHAAAPISPYEYTPPSARSQPVPVLIASPHSSVHLPADFKSSCPASELNQSVDLYVDELVSCAPEHGIGIIKAEFSRVHIDPNRSVLDIDPALLKEPWPDKSKPSDRSKYGKGLIHRTTKSGNDIYATPLSNEDIRHRIDTCYTPYHNAVKAEMDKLVQIFGVALLLDMHAMWPVARPHKSHGKKSDFIIGDRDGQSCGRDYRNFIKERLKDMGYHVAVNDMFKGAEILRRYGKPHRYAHALQIEINKELYLDARTLDKGGGFNDLQKALCHLIKDTQSYFFEQKTL